MPAFVTAMNTASSSADAEKTEKVAEELRQIWDLDRVWAAFDGDRLVGTFRSFATQLTVPGCAQVPGTALTAVSVMADHRRQGILRAMVAAEHGAARDRGEVLALLYSAEYAIYGRFGYGPRPRGHADARRSPPSSTAHGQRRVRPAVRSDGTMIRVFEAQRARLVGEVACVPYRWDYRWRSGGRPGRH
jgi:predicted acetyltransferase